MILPITVEGGILVQRRIVFPPREHNLKGTMRTLDRADGEVELEYGLMDKSGRTFF